MLHENNNIFKKIDCRTIILLRFPRKQIENIAKNAKQINKMKKTIITVMYGSHYSCLFKYLLRLLTSKEENKYHNKNKILKDRLITKKHNLPWLYFTL